ncbi:thioesterase family protein [Candidatus Chlorohelix sp.]|uniref:thioesterase family protein n=1 Tax=Candidatus Chlorohelix sp. TaxID=3139201 RepID=UPI00314556AE
MSPEQTLKVGMKASVEVEVVDANTAATFGSGLARVYSTPNMIGLMETASWHSVQNAMPEGFSTVGTLVEVKHIAASPVGFKIRAEAELAEIDGRRLVFKVVAYDDVEKVGEGVHERFIIDNAKFMGRVEQKAKKQGI